MKADVVLMTPAKAKELLLMNQGNRTMNQETVKSYASEMLAGRWKENGESIIIDKDNFIKDGQHRLNAIIMSNKSYHMVVVYDVDYNVMESIDIGRNRTLPDVLSINGFKNSNQIAAISRAIILHSRGIVGDRIGSGKGTSHRYISNGVGLDYVYENEADLYKILSVSQSIYGKSKKVLGIASIAKYTYMVANNSFNYTDYHLDFINQLCGLEYTQGRAASYVFDKLFNARLNKIRMSDLWVYNAIVKAWNCYVTGSDDIRSMVIKTDRIEKINFI